MKSCNSPEDVLVATTGFWRKMVEISQFSQQNISKADEDPISD
jgi:hypothetical protein